MAKPPDFYAAYNQRVKLMSESNYLVYPFIVHIETLVLCPAACSFCPYPGLERKGTRMDDELIDKILDDLRAIPKSVPFQIFPFKVNEPFLEPRLVRILKKINQTLPQVHLNLISSGAPLTRAKLLELNEIKQLQHLTISLHEYRPEAYSKLMNLSWERTLKRLDLLHELTAAQALAYPVQLIRVSDGSEHDAGFLRWCQVNYPLFRASLFQRGTWINQVEGLDPVILSPEADKLTPLPSGSAPMPDIGCLRWFELSITATGEVAYCCMDGQARWPQGNVRHLHLLDIYNQPARRHQREKAISRQGKDPCKSCTFM